MSSTADEFAPHPFLLPYIARTITGFGAIYNKYQVHGLEHLPARGGALLVLYHGLVPLDFWYLGLKIYLQTGRKPCALVDRFLLKTPGLAWLTKAVGGVSGDPEVALDLLKKGTIVGVAPGGVREALKGKSQNYRLVWGERKGFARLALEANVPIIPGFTQNVEGLYRAPFADHPLFRSLYEATRLPLTPILGIGPLPFPVPLTTWLGQPLIPTKKDTAETLTERTRTAIEQLIAKHQGT